MQTHHILDLIHVQTQTKNASIPLLRGLQVEKTLIIQVTRVTGMEAPDRISQRLDPPGSVHDIMTVVPEYTAFALRALPFLP